MNRLILWIVGLATVAGCRPEATPKPRGYFRIEHPEATYRVVQPECPVAFELPQYAAVERVVSASGSEGNCWFNVVFPSMHARWHMTWVPVAAKGISELIEDAHQLAFSHDVKALGIGRKRFAFPEHSAYGVFFELDGPVASPLQFYATDSIGHFLRGSLYFDHVPNPDSLAPSLDRVRSDARHLLETLIWLEQ